MIDQTKQNKVRPPLKLKNGFELASRAPKKIPMLIEGLLLEVGASILCAKPKCGKSTLARQVAVAVAEGTDVLGLPTICGDVLYLILEGPIGAVQQHLKQLGHTGKHGTIHVADERLPNSLDEVLDLVGDAVKNHPGIQLVIIDPLSKFLRLADADKYEPVGEALEKVEHFAKKYKLHVLGLMHNKKRLTDDVGDGMLGSTSFRGATDTNIYLSKDKNGQRIISTEQRWGKGIEPTILVFDEETGSSRLGVTVEVQEKEQHETKGRKTDERIEQDILGELTSGKKLATHELLAAVTGKTSTKLDVLERLVSSGRVAEQADGKATRYSLAALPVAAPVEVQP